MTVNVLLLGRTTIILEDLEPLLGVPDVNFVAATNISDVQTAIAARPIHHVIMGAGIDLDDRLAIIRYIFETSTSTTVHMKDWDSGPAGMLPFVSGVLSGLAPPSAS